MQQDEERTLFTVAEVARQLGISENTVRSAIKRGSLGVERVSPRLNMVTAQAVETYRQKHLGKRGGYRGRQPVAADEAAHDTSAEDTHERKEPYMSRVSAAADKGHTPMGTAEQAHTTTKEKPR